MLSVLRPVQDRGYKGVGEVLSRVLGPELECPTLGGAGGTDCSDSASAAAGPCRPSPAHTVWLGVRQASALCNFHPLLLAEKCQEAQSSCSP